MIRPARYRVYKRVQGRCYYACRHSGGRFFFSYTVGNAHVFTAEAAELYVRRANGVLKSIGQEPTFDKELIT